jgi:hypothetical protein
MNEPLQIPCFGGPLDGKTHSYSAAILNVLGMEKDSRYHHCWYSRPFFRADGTRVMQNASFYLIAEDMTADYKIPPERMGELSWLPTEEEILRQAEAKGRV